MSSSGASKCTAAMRLPFSIRSSARHGDHSPGMAHRAARMRAAADLTISVSPSTIFTLSTGTPSRSATTCAKLVSWPWPLGCVPITTSTRPSGLHRDLGVFARRADRGFDVIGKAERRELAALLRLAPALPRSLPVGDAPSPSPCSSRRCRCRRRCRPRCGTASLPARSDCGGAARRGRSRARRAAMSISRSSAKLTSGRPELR